MILVCNACKASYLVPASVFANGPRQVKCARCAHAWMADLPPKTTAMPMEASHTSRTHHPESEAKPNPATVLPPNVSTDPAFATPEPPLARKEKTDVAESLPPAKNLPAVRSTMAWGKIRTALEISMGGVIAAGLIVFLVNSPYMSRCVRETEKLFYAVGLTNPLAGEGFSLQGVRSERRYENGGMQLVVEGVILNEADEMRPVPDINVNALGPDKKIIQSWRIEAPKATLPAGASAPFHSSIVTPPGTVMEVNLSFAEPRHDDKP